MGPSDSELKEIQKTDEACDNFLECGNCPKKRYLTRLCPMNILDLKGYRYCCVDKEK